MTEPHIFGPSEGQDNFMEEERCHANTDLQARVGRHVVRRR